MFVWGLMDGKETDLDSANIADVLHVLVDRRLEGHVLRTDSKALPVLRFIAAPQYTAFLIIVLNLYTYTGA